MNKVTHINQDNVTVTRWNHRVVHRTFADDTEEYSIREVYYNDDGSIFGFTESPIQVYGDTLAELKETVQRLMNCTDFPILEEDQIVCAESRDE